jgi:hypothetical protein
LVLQDAASGLGFPQVVLTGQNPVSGAQFSADWHTGFGS